MADQDWLAQRFQEHRSRLEAVAYRMLGSRSDADDAVQEAWLRLSRTDPSTVDNLGGWLTTVVGRVCLDMLRSRAAHREQPLEGNVPQVQASDATPSADVTRQTDLVKAFLDASRNGDFTALLEALDPEVVLRADSTAIQAGALAEVRGAHAVVNQFAERAVETLPTLVAETPGTVWAITSRAPRAAFRFTVRGTKIVRIDLVFDPQQLCQLDLAIPDR